jgi:undecaprenyl-diphosphatase
VTGPALPKAAAGALALLLLVVPAAAKADDPPRPANQHFTIDPVSDIVLTGASAGFALLLSGILSTGEIRPSTLSPGDERRLLSIDRLAVTQSIDPNADTYSNIGLYAGVAFAVLDPLLSGARDGWDAGVVDAVLYAETVSLTEALTDMTKIAVRRPRPLAYVQCEHAAPTTTCASTDIELSFFSGHAATVASITATATYLAFQRSPHTPRPWLTLALGTALTGFVSYERVRAGAHFPTDVLAGSVAGAAVGVLVPHLHRNKDDAPRVWIGAAPTEGGPGGILTAQGFF